MKSLLKVILTLSLFISFMQADKIKIEKEFDRIEVCTDDNGYFFGAYVCLIDEKREGTEILKYKFEQLKYNTRTIVINEYNNKKFYDLSKAYHFEVDGKILSYKVKDAYIFNEFSGGYVYRTVQEEKKVKGLK